MGEKEKTVKSLKAEWKQIKAKARGEWALRRKPPTGNEADDKQEFDIETLKILHIVGVSHGNGLELVPELGLGYSEVGEKFGPIKYELPELPAEPQYKRKRSDVSSRSRKKCANLPTIKQVKIQQEAKRILRFRESERRQMASSIGSFRRSTRDASQRLRKIDFSGYSIPRDLRGQNID
ncbi:hypothetical protein QAD02_017050 [Eretmocerus hayati]|uniref:Uncharacterized protein n=1 Tax=Eretmocerus hayati TaxID=131215 RepID=A0ACC2PCV5_9HYME|nr:hypothetical protein QAD02_017050 [Eretmocerus hayati]